MIRVDEKGLLWKIWRRINILRVAPNIEELRGKLRAIVATKEYQDEFKAYY